MIALRSVVIGSLLGLSAVAAQAQSAKDAYVQDARGVIVRDANFGDARIGNLCWRTGYWSPAQAIAECDPDIAPRPAAPAPAPAPAAAPVPVQPPMPSKPAPAAPRACDFVDTLGTDQTFEFNKSVLRASAKTQLDSVVAKAKNCATVNVLLVTGNTDRLGSAAYNQKLSELRAAAVAGYLATKGLGGAQISGAGKTLPIKSCDDKLGRKALIDCLAPNRRVVVDVKGTGR